MSQPATGPGVATADSAPKPARVRTSTRVSQAVKSGVVYGGSAILGAVTNIAPHLSGAVDILVVEQPDGSRKATPFYVRFGKYTAMRTRERDVKLYVNGELAPFSMHIGMYGQAYFTAETEEAREGDEDEQDALLAGMMSPPSGYSSGAEGAEAGAGGSAAAGETLAAVRQRIEGAGGAGGGKVSRKGTGASDAAGGAAANGASSRASGRTPVPALGAAPPGAAVAASTGAIAPTPPVSPPVGSAFGQQAAAYTSSPASLLKAPSLAPLLTAADRNESFMSARETLSLATPLGEDLVAASAAASASASPGMTASRPAHMFRQSLHPGGGSSSSLAAVSEDGNEGASPRGWSEAGSEAGGGAAGSSGAGQPGGASPPCRSPFGSPPAPVVPAHLSGAAGDGADAGGGAGPRQGRGHGAGDHGPAHQHWPAPGSAMHRGGGGGSHPHPHPHHQPAQQPQHTQFGFPDNHRSPASAAGGQGTPGSGGRAGSQGRDGSAVGGSAMGPYGVPAPLPLQLSGGGVHSSPPGHGSGQAVMCAACGALSPSSAWPSPPPPHGGMALPPLPHRPDGHGVAHGHQQQHQQGARLQPSVDWAALLGPGPGPGPGAGAGAEAAAPAGLAGGHTGPKTYAAVAADPPHPHPHPHPHHPHPLPHYHAPPPPPPPAELPRPYAVPIDLASLPRPVPGHIAAAGAAGAGDSLAATTAEGALPGHGSGSGSHGAVSLLSTSLRSAGRAAGSYLANDAAAAAAAAAPAADAAAAAARVVVSIRAVADGRVRLHLTVVAPPPWHLPLPLPTAFAMPAQPQLPGLPLGPGYGHTAAHAHSGAPAAATAGRAGSAQLDGAASAASDGGYMGDGERGDSRARPGGGYVAGAGAPVAGPHRQGIPVGAHGHYQHPHPHPHSHHRPHDHTQHAVHRDFGFAAAAGAAGVGIKLGALAADDASAFPHSASAPLPVSALDAAAAAAAAAAGGAAGREGGAVGRTITGMGAGMGSGMQRVSSQAQLPAADVAVPGVAATHAAALLPQPSPPAASSPLPQPAAVLELSLCGRLLTPQLPYPVVAALFDGQRLSEEAFAAQGGALLSSPDLVVRLGATGAIYTWQALSAALVGLLAYGTCRVPPDTPCWVPTALEGAVGAGAGVGAGGAGGDVSGAMAAAVASLLATAVGGRDGGVPGGPGGMGMGMGGLNSATATPKKGAPGAAATSSGGSWRLWPFGTRRDPSGRTSATGAAPVVPAGSVSFAAGSPPLSSPLALRQGSSGAAGFATYSAPLPRQASSGLGAGEEGEDKGLVAATASRDMLGARGSGSRRVREDGVALITKKSLTPAPEQLAALPLQHGQNTISYKIGSAELKAYVYYLPWRTKIVISDIDGTITKSDVLGHLLPAMGLDWSHPGIAQLLTNIRQNNYLIMYLSSRSIGQANITRDFINSLVQGEHRMPLGPVIISPHGLLPSLYREMILRRPHEFKIATLQDIRALFPPDWNPFYAGFGNRDTDEISYKEVGMQPKRIFIINPRGELRQPADTAADPAIAAALSTISAAAAVAVAASAASAPVLATATSGASAATIPHSLSSALPSAASEPPPATDLTAAASTSSGAAHPTPERQASDVSALTSSTPDLAAVSAPVLGSSATPAPPVRSATVPARGSRAAAADGKAAVAALSLSAINDLVHDLFPPLRDGEPAPSSSAGSTAASEQGQLEGEEQEAEGEEQEAEGEEQEAEGEEQEAEGEEQEAEGEGGEEEEAAVEEVEEEAKEEATEEAEEGKAKPAATADRLKGPGSRPAAPAGPAETTSSQGKGKNGDASNGAAGAGAAATAGSEGEHRGDGAAAARLHGAAKGKDRRQQAAGGKGGAGGKAGAPEAD